MIIEELESADVTVPPIAVRVWTGPGRVVAAALGVLVALAVITPLIRVSSPQPETSRDLTQPPDRAANTLVPASDARVWQQLEQRPVRLPSLGPGAPCPVSSTALLTGGAMPAAVGDGPVYAYPVPDGAAIRLGPGSLQSGRDGALIWIARPELVGPALIRGARLDANGDVRFDGRATELRFDVGAPVVAGNGTSATASEWRYLPSPVYVPAPGCYGFQIDLPNTTIRIILAAVPL